MIATTIKRIVRAGWLNFQRNAFVSLTAVVVMVVTLFVITSTIFLGAVLDATLQDIRNRVDVRVVFNTDAPVNEITVLQGLLENRPDVREVRYTSREQALAAFENRHQGDEIILQALAELDGNPLGASLNIQAEDPSSYRDITDWIATTNYFGQGGIIDTVNFEDNEVAINRLTSFMNGVERLGLIVTIALVIVSILITFNTIRLTIYASRDEIAIMRLVGASAGYIRGPFVVSGVIYGSIASAFTIVAFYPLTFWLGGVTAGYIQDLDLLKFYLDNLIQIALLIVFSGIFIGAMSSYLAVKRYLKV